MATLTHNPESAPPEPTTRIVSRELPNLRNPVIAAEYRRQRDIINAALASQCEELEFWEAVQTYEGWN